jgi:hypothetical protein
MFRVIRPACILLLLFIASCGTDPASSADATLPWPKPDAKVVAEFKAELKEKLDSTFAISTVGPWVIATNMDPVESQRIVDSTIRKCAAGIQRQLFTKTARTAPAKVYLFRDGESYEAWNKKLFNEKPQSIFGYYSRGKNSLVMNIGTGGGTLIHEIVHAMAEVDFPEIPVWLNEGLGALYEASDVAPSGKIIGVTNWRLKGLQEDLKTNTETQIDKLMELTDADFYGDRRSANYASARYLMQWLQEQGKLEAFYIRVRDQKDNGPKLALMAVFDNTLTLAEIHKKCFDWARTLTFRRGG